MATHTRAHTAICSSQLSVMIQFYGPQKRTNQVLPSLSEWAGSGRKRSWALDQLRTAAKQWSSNDAHPRPDHWVTASLAASVKSRVFQDTESCSGRHRVPKAFPPETIGGSFAWVLTFCVQYRELWEIPRLLHSQDEIFTAKERIPGTYQWAQDLSTQVLSWLTSRSYLLASKLVILVK